MSLGMIATGFGIARAASLGIVTSDLSCELINCLHMELNTDKTLGVYAITAIWSNLELYLGIVGANLALGRSIWAHFFKKDMSTNRSAYELSGPYYNSAIHGSGHQSTYIRSNNRAPSPSRSDNSDLPLEPGIQKRTDVWITSEAEHGDRKQ